MEQHTLLQQDFEPLIRFDAIFGAFDDNIVLAGFGKIISELLELEWAVIDS